MAPTTAALITPPAAEPISLDQVKQHLGVTGSEQDDLISLYLSAARQWIDGPSWLGGRTLMPQTWDLVIDTFPIYEIEFPLTPVQSVTQVAYDDANGDPMIMAPETYYLDNVGDMPWLVPGDEGWPETLDAVNSVRIRFIAGYLDAASVPSPIKAALLLMVGHLYAFAGQSLFLRREIVDGVGSQEWTVSNIAGQVITQTVTSLLSPYRIMIV
jgi:uncharacterized phiE125 gp8 family phage protein